MPDQPNRPETLPALLQRTARLMVGDLIERLQAAGYHDTTAAHHPVFANLDRGGTRLTVLAERTGMTHQSMSELVSVLEARDYVERVPDRTDGRARLVRLTRRGRDATRRALRELREIEAAWQKRFDADLRPMLEAALRDIEEGTDATDHRAAS